MLDVLTLHPWQFDLRKKQGCLLRTHTPFPRLVVAAGIAPRSWIVAVRSCCRSTTPMIYSRGLIAGGLHATMLILPRCVSVMSVASHWLGDLVLEAPLRYTMS
jgi:hypothetical protein